MNLTPHDVDRVASYVDGLLPPSERAAFEAELKTSPALQEELELQSSLDASLGRLFEYTDAAPAAPAPLPIAAHRKGPKLLKWVSVAAAFVLAAIGAWYVLRPDPLLIPPEKVWNNMVAVNFKPVWRCENDAEFKRLLDTKLGENFTIDETKGVHVVGWAYGQDYKQYPLSKDTLILINKIENDHSIILIDRADKARTLKVPASTGLHIYERKVGGLVLYEVTPRTHPDVLDAVVKGCP
jgi:hypothetical protein